MWSQMNAQWHLDWRLTLKQSILLTVGITVIFIILHYGLNALSKDNNSISSSAVAAGSVGTWITQEEMAQLYADKWWALYSKIEKEKEYQKASQKVADVDQKIEAAKAILVWNQ